MLKVFENCSCLLATLNLKKLRYDFLFTFHYNVNKGVNKTVRFYNLKVVFPSQSKLNTLLGFKDTLNKKIRSFLVYIYTCSNCNVTYYDKTYHHFFARASKHMGVSNLTGKRLKNIKDSASLDHLLQCSSPLILIILIFWLLTSVNLIFQ